MTPSLLDDQDRLTAATTFLLVHRALRRDCGRFPLAVRSLSYGEVDRARRIAERWRTFRAVLDDHHSAEDTRLFPALLAAEPGLTGVRDPAPIQLSPGPPRQPSAAGLDDPALAWLAEDLDAVTLAVLAAELPPSARPGLPDLLRRQRRSAALVWGGP